jgi:hypothetical protein
MVVAEHVNMFCILGLEGTTAGAHEQRAIDRDGLRVRAEFPPWAAIGSARIDCVRVNGLERRYLLIDIDTLFTGVTFAPQRAVRR